MLDKAARNDAGECRMAATPFVSKNLPVRKGGRPKTFVGPMHVQCDGNGDPRYVRKLLDAVLSWPYINPPDGFANQLDRVSIQLQEIVATGNSPAFVCEREFARVLLLAPTITLVLPLVCAHWAIVRGWAEPHYLQSAGVMPAGTVVLYTPRDGDELEVCYALFFESYYSACGFVAADVSHSVAAKPRLVPPGQHGFAAGF
jgi:hypothetical protein